MIRPATIDDIEAIVSMGVRFSKETDYGDRIQVDPVRVWELTSNLMAMDNAVVLLSEGSGGVDGMIGMLLYDHPFSGERMAFEVVWWVEPEARGSGVKLLRAAEKWAREQGATSMQMVAPEGTKVGQLYERMQYAPVERSYQRRLH